MNDKLADAYNEWLLLFGYRVVPIGEIDYKHSTLKLYLHREKAVIRKDPLRYADITYQLKPLDEIQ